MMEQRIKYKNSDSFWKEFPVRTLKKELVYDLLQKITYSVTDLNNLSTILRLGRAMGIHAVLSTQRPSRDVIPGVVVNNSDIRICGRADDVLSQIILDKTDASDLIPKDAQGRFLTNNDVLFQAYWFDDTNI